MKEIDSHVNSFGPLLSSAGMFSTPAASRACAGEPLFRVYEIGNNDLGRKDTDRFIGRPQAIQDLDVLAKSIDDNSSYIWASTFSYRRAIEKIASRLPENVSVNGLSTQLDRFIRLFGDDHAEVIEWRQRIPQGVLPLQIGKEGSRYFLYSIKPAGLLNAEYPYVSSIDGVAIDEWMRVLGDVTQGPLSSEAARFGRSFSAFPFVEYLRGQMNLPAADPVKLEMVSDDGDRTTTMYFPLQPYSQTPPKAFSLPNESRMLSDNVGYMRVPAHTGELERKLVNAIPSLMEEFRSAKALIIDARQCGGGERAVLNALFPYFMPPNSKPYVFNVIKLRKSQVAPGQDPAALFDDVEKRFLYAGDSAAPEVDMESYREFSKNFIPTWAPPADKFTDWYFMALHPSKDKPYYENPVYVLIDWGIGSAGDVFASAFKSWPNVTLVGSATMGRSGQRKKTLLPNSQLEIYISTMASFQKTGERYDTVGIQPDIKLDPIPSDWYGETDSVLGRVQDIIDKRLQ